jgi:hypothetical protein
LQFNRFVPSNRSSASVGVVSLASAGLLAAMIFSPGFPSSSVTMHDGSVWVTSTEQGKLGRLNRQIDQLDAALFPASANFDVQQSGDAVLLTDLSGAAQLVDVASTTLSGAVPGPEGARYALGGETVAVLDPASGDAWVLPLAELMTTRFAETAPTANVGVGAMATVGVDGTAHLLSVSADTLVSVAPAGEPDQVDLGIDVAEDAQLSAVGNVAAVLSGSSLLLVDGGVTTVSTTSAGEALALQQPGPQSPDVAVAGSEGLFTAPLRGGDLSTVLTGVAGRAASPVLVAGCYHGAWSGEISSYGRRCGSAEAKTAELSPGGGAELRFRVNRSVVALNSTGTGFTWVMNDTGETVRVDNWQDFAPEGTDDGRETQEQQNEQANADDVCSPANFAPDAMDDEFGVRRGQPALLPVTANDTDADTCDVVAITTVEQPPADQGRFDIVAAGTSLQYTPASDFEGLVAVRYTITDGRGKSDTATVRVNVRGGDANSAPVPLPGRESRTTVEAGQQVTYNVLGDWQDPDGDPLLLQLATSEEAVIRWSPDGLITVVDAGSTPQRIAIPFVVTDGRATADGVLRVDVQPRGSLLAPTAANDFVVGVVGRPASVRPLDNDTDPNGDLLRLVSATQPDGAVVAADTTTGTVTITASREGTFLSTYTISDGNETVTGTIRFEAQPASQGRPPVAVVDKVQTVPGGTPTLVDALANDADPDGDPLAIVSASTLSDKVVVSVVDFERLRIATNSVLDAPAIVNYTISDGLNTATGVVLVTTVPGQSADQPPVARTDIATVRVGSVVDIPVLDNDTDPEGGRLTIGQQLAEAPAAGLMFVSGDRLRYVAGDQPGNATGVYQVRDRNGQAVTARVSITVLADDAATNRPPQPRSIAARVVAGGATEIPIPLTGIDPDGDNVFLAAAESSPTIGTLEPLAPGGTSFTYKTPTDLQEGGVDQFRYVVADSFNAQASGVVTVLILPRQANQSPVTMDDVVTVQPGRTVSVPALANDSDPDGDPLRVAKSSDIEGVTFGGQAVTINAPEDEGASLNVPYIADDGRGGRTSGLISLTATSAAAKVPPIAVDDAATDVAPDATEVTVPVRDNDSDPDGTREDLKVALVNSADGTAGEGSVTVALQDRPRLVVYSVTDIDGNTSYALVSVPGKLLARFPVLTPGTMIDAKIGDTVTVRVADVVTDPQGKPMTLTEEMNTTPGAGTAAPVDAGSFTFTPAEGSPADVKVGIGVRTEDGRTARIDVPFRVTSQENRPPVAKPATLRVPRGDGEVKLPLGAYTSDPDPGTTLSFSNAAGAGGLSTVRIDGNDLVVAADAGAPLGPVSISYTVSDGEAEAQGTVAAEVTETSKPMPRAVEGTTEADQGQAVSINVLRDDFNPFSADGKALTIESASVPQSDGQASSDGTNVNFTSAPGYFGITTITYRIRDAAGRAVDGQERVVVSGPPAAPGRPTIDPQGAKSRQVTLTWEPSTDNGATLTGYKVEPESGKPTTCPPMNSCTITGLTNGTKYRFRVVAVNAKGDSPASDWSEVVEPDQAPDAPKAPAVRFGSASLQVSWEPPANSGTAVTDYIVTWNGQSKWVGNVTSHTINNLANGTAYDVAITAVNSAGKSAPSPATREIPAAAPTPPTVGTPELVEGATGSTLRVSWTPGADGGAALTSVTVTPYKNGAAQAGRSVAQAGATSDAFPVPNDGAAWSYTVTVANKAGSAVSALSGQTEAYVAPGAPSVTATAVRNGVTFQITPPASNGGKSVTGYLVRRIGGVAVAVAPGQTISNSALGINTLGTVNDSYSFEVQATNGKPGPWGSGNSTAPFGDVQQSRASVLGVGKDYLDVQWGRVVENGRPVTTIQVWALPVGKTSVTSSSFDANVGGTGRIIELQCGSSYDIKVFSADSEIASRGIFLLSRLSANGFQVPPGGGVSVIAGVRTAPCAVPGAPIVVNAANTFGDTSPVPMRAGASRTTADLGLAVHGTALTARCGTRGQLTTDGSNQTAEDDARTFTSDLWYGVDWGGGRAFISSVWSTKRDTTLGLPGC